MNLKNSVLLIAGSAAGIVGSFLTLTHTPGGEFLRGFGAGILIVLSFHVIPKLIKKKYETTSR
ncbi:MAG TPA: hypothetical protein PKJ83_06065 [Cyclobacteriaceae bacterium]|nr:hypothetical protein [Cyclobacteriaceae bacterium]